MDDIRSLKAGRGSTQTTRKLLRAIWRVSSFILLLFFFILSLPSFASAEGAAYAEIGIPDVTKFPTITTVLDVYNASGQFVSGLTLADVTMREDESARPVQALTEFPVGAQIVVAFNPGPPLGVRDGQGITRYQKVQRAIQAWAQSLDAKKGDDLSLVSIAGLINAHTGPSEFAAALSAFQPEFRSTTTNIQTLSLALDAALVPTPQVGMKRVVLFVTPRMDDPNLESSLVAITTQAVKNHVRINVWFVDSETAFGHSSAALFQTLAAQTGGEFVAFDTGTLPDLETYFAPLRKAYQVTYMSALNTSGDHRLSAEVNLGGERIASAAQTFALNVQPPNPILAKIPAQISRRPPPDDPYNETILEPTQQPLEVIFDFPDGHQRPIVSVTLYVDGAVAATNTSGALDRFTWDISPYTVSAQHTLRVEATDTLGLTGTSIETPVFVQVVRAPVTPLVLLARYRYVLVGVIVSLAGLILLGVLVSGRLRLPSLRARRQRQQRYADPLTQPVTIASTEPPSSPKMKPGRPKAAVLADAPASLIRLRPDGEPASASPIPLLGDEVSLGTDPVQASFVLDEPALSPLHARIQRTEAGYMIFDPGSVAGTWVNYEPVTRQGHPLKHGDRVHLGHLMYRFLLKNPPIISEPKIITDS